MQIGVNRIAFELGSVAISWYGIFIALAVIWLIFWMWWRVRKGAKLSLDTVLSMALVGIPSGIIFARLLHVVDNIVIARLHPELAITGQVIDYLREPSKIIGGDGLTIYGAVLGASLGIWIYCKIAKVKIGYVFDLVAPAIVVAQAIGRVGCTLNGCCYGSPTTLPWGIEYTNPNSFGFGAGVVHPTTIYEIIFCLILFVVLLKLRGRLKPDGTLYLVYLSAYSAWRIGIDFLREGQPFLASLHQAQVIGFIVLLITLPWMINHTRWVKKEELAPPAPDDKTELA
ncbi:MAG: prolipoprotein diacylglyceryl transferase [Dehalococcoidales bacterium]|nr:prolipoprotein diacylglyceryl transferase [Dehalococcoidales bacterium]